MAAYASQYIYFQFFEWFQLPKLRGTQNLQSNSYIASKHGRSSVLLLDSIDRTPERGEGLEVDTRLQIQAVIHARSFSAD